MLLLSGASKLLIPDSRKEKLRYTTFVSITKYASDFLYWKPTVSVP